MAQITKTSRSTVDVEGRNYSDTLTVSPETCKFLQENANKVAYNADQARWDYYDNGKHTTLQRKLYTALTGAKLTRADRVFFKNDDHSDFRLKNLQISA
jgi:hypothetical protein